MEYLRRLKSKYEIRYPGLKIEQAFKHQYENMRKYLEKKQKIVDLAKKAIKLAGVEVKIHSIRGGTDGSRLSFMGLPTPNLFAGGHNFHAITEFIAVQDMHEAVKMIATIAQVWEEKS